MKTISPSVVWMYDDDKDAILVVKQELGRRDSSLDAARFRPATSFDELAAWVSEPVFLCDSVILDIVGSEDELTWVENALRGSLAMERLCDLTGIRLLAFLQHHLPNLPIVMMSAYVSPSRQIDQAETLRSLTRLALCAVAKGSTHILRRLLWIAQQTIIGIRVPEALTSSARRTLNKVNEMQNHFYFAICNGERDLVAPPRAVLEGVEEPSDRLRCYEAWNGRVLALSEDAELQAAAPLSPLLPFGSRRLRRFSNQISREVLNMGDGYLAPYLVRECALAAYRTYFDIAFHPIDTGECLFDSSTHPPDLLAGIERGRLCARCQLQLVPTHASGGWSKGRGEAAALIAALAREELQVIVS